ncbi:hypothetical protein [Planomonospora venezuelensis]|uniref:Lipoprotein n=1 Tax=Planomonospora venezuelensis TaxID=1999 RepID=A0A841CXV8_PLAVE|nr:hypothetical protein [Planomonospora venezuelensis]MBB5962791.1 hypothetical protein [Planomonospora venezuelensis]GIM99412.1 hypothetical protein Pve01_10710 [Planomonospora venezuelensis]
MSRTVRPFRAPLALAAALALMPAVVLGGCGIAPSGVRDWGRPPVISYSPTWVTVYLVRAGRLEPARVPVVSDSAKNIVDTLFRAGKQPPRPGLTSELNGFSHYDSKTTRYTGTSQRGGEPASSLGYRLNVVLSGEGGLSRLGLAQITCTVRQNKQESIWSVEITRLFPGTPASLGDHSCFEFRDLAAEGVRLPP